MLDDDDDDDDDDAGGGGGDDDEEEEEEDDNDNEDADRLHDFDDGDDGQKQRKTTLIDCALMIKSLWNSMTYSNLFSTEVGRLWFPH